MLDPVIVFGRPTVLTIISADLVMLSGLVVLLSITAGVIPADLK